MGTTRRELLTGGAGGLITAAVMPVVPLAAATTVRRDERLGRWDTTRSGLPVYRYTGGLPAHAVDRSGADAQLAPDPAFLIGNHRITVFTHASGVLQIITGDRAWARVNAAGGINYGDNSAAVTVGGMRYDLVGLASLAADPARTTRMFGCGFARYEHRVTPTLTVRRVVSVAPSMQVGQGHPALVVSVTLTNDGRRAEPVEYRESVRSHYVPMGDQKTRVVQRTVRYPSTVTRDSAAAVALATTRCVPAAFAVAAEAREANRHDLQPACVFVHARGDAAVRASIDASTDAALAAAFSGSVPARTSVTVQIVIGLTRGDLAAAAAEAAAVLALAGHADPADGLFAAAWRTHLPHYASEPSDTLRSEMVWNAHALAAMATYTEYFDETFVPQGTIYAYEDGENISNRDNLQALLPLCYVDPPLARSCLRHVLKQTSPIGEIKRGTGGFGYVSPGIYKESDEQLYLFLALGEYLRITGDASILDDRVSFYPRQPDRETSVLDMLGRHFVYLRDEVGVGPNGLVRMLNSDWSDSFFHAISPNVTQGTAESHLNSAMALAVLPVLIDGLTAARRADTASLIEGMEAYRAALHAAYMKDLGDRDFSARAYINDGKPRFGVDSVCLEPQGWLLQIPGLPLERKRRIYAWVKVATFAPEKIGFRIRERPIFGSKGEGEDGGFWFAIEHQMIAGVASFDPAEARRLLETTSFHNYARQYPDYTLGRWTHSDSMQSSLSPREGLLNYWLPTLRQSGFGYCSHPHSWPLYNYHRVVA